VKIDSNFLWLYSVNFVAYEILVRVCELRMQDKCIGQTLEQAAQGGSGVPIPGGVQKTCRCGTSGHGLVRMVVLGGWLDLMILEVFFNL